MRKLRTALIGGAVAVAATGAAVAASEHIHMMKVNLPDGAVAQIHYTGDVAPKVEVVSGPAAQRLMAVPVGLDDDAFFAANALLLRRRASRTTSRG